MRLAILRKLIGSSVPLFMVLVSCSHGPLLYGQTLKGLVGYVQPKIVKIMGSGGFQGLEPYQTGIVISQDGYLLTVWSYVLDSDVVYVTTDDGRRFEAQLVGYDPRIEIAVLKISARDLAWFNLDSAGVVNAGSRILAFSNLYGVATGNEPVSVQQGIVAAKTKLSARRGAFASNYRDQAYLLDAMTNNPGAPGGAVTDLEGRLLGMIGKELKDENTGAWINFAIPIGQLADSVHEIRAGRMVVQAEMNTRQPTEPITCQLLGIVLLPDIFAKTPPYVDRIISGLTAEQQGILPDDLIIEINGNLTPSIKEVTRQLSQIDRDDEMEVTVQRNGKFLTLTLGLLR